MLFLFKEKKLICYLDPKPNAYIKKIATSCQKAEKITIPNFFIKSFPLQNHPQPSLSSWGCGVSLYFHNFQKCNICSFDNFLNLLFTIYYYFLSYRNSEISNAVFPCFLTFKNKQETSSNLIQTYKPNTIEDNSFHLEKSKKSSFYKEFLV